MNKAIITLICIVGSLVIATLVLMGSFTNIAPTKVEDNKTTPKETQPATITPNNTNTPSSINNAPDTATTSPTDTEPEPVSTTHEIDYTNTGFAPSNLSVKIGDTVIFNNNSSGSMWIASDPHPTHTLYPEFDQKKSVAKDGSYTFIFDKEGTWGYHNHVNATRKGTVTVTK